MIAVKQELEITLETSLMLAAPGTPIHVLAERIYDAESDLMEKLKRPWMVDRLTWMLKRKRQKIAPSHQLSLPGFEKLPSRLVMKDGRWVLLRAANLKQLEQFRMALVRSQKEKIERLSEGKDVKVEQLDRLIELVRGYSRQGVKITVQDVMAKEQERLEGTSH